MPWLLAYVVFVSPLVWSDRPSNLSSDEAAYYLPAVERIRSHWPAIDLVGDSLSATAPGYTYFLATVSQVTGSDRLTLRLVNLGVSVGVLAAGWAILGRAGIAPLLFILPLALCNFFVKSSGFVVTDNAALLAIALTLGATLFANAGTGVLAAAGCATLAVAVRQNSLWLLAPLAFRFLGQANRAGRKLGLLALLLPLVPVIVLALAWQGLARPSGSPPRSPLASRSCPRCTCWRFWRRSARRSISP